MALKQCSNCKHCSIRDAGYGQYERHDWFCWKYFIWEPEPCEDYKEDS